MMSTRSKSAEADVGILGKNNDDTVHDDSKKSVEDIIDDGPMISSRLDVYNFVGSSSFAGKAGTKTIPALPQTPGLFVHDIGRISLPITPSQAESLKEQSWKTTDDGEFTLLSN
jgi:hypothetical protein